MDIIIRNGGQLNITKGKKAQKRNKHVQVSTHGYSNKKNPSKFVIHRNTRYNPIIISCAI